MMWGIISSATVGAIVHFYGNINASVYKEIHRKHSLPHLRKMTVGTPIFMQGNTPSHKTISVLIFFF